MPTWPNAGLAGLMLGLAELSKSSWVILFGLWPLLWLFWLLTEPGSAATNDKSRLSLSTQLWRQIPQFTSILLLALYLLNLGYGFEGSFTKLGRFQFVSTALTGMDKPGEVGNRFKEGWLASVPVPLPANYVRGIDVQKKDFENYATPNYLRGEWKEDGGWWYYYLYALVVKGALGTWVMLGMAIVMASLGVGGRHNWRDEILLVTPALTLLILVSSQTEINAHLRYVLPVIGIFLVFCSRAALGLTMRSVPCRIKVQILPLLLGSVLWTVVTTTWNYPHQLAYFNELVCGTESEYKHLLGSNLDWGQGNRMRMALEMHLTSLGV